MSEPDADLGEWAPPDPADVARYDDLMEARGAQETAHQQELAAAEVRRQAWLSGDSASRSEADQDWRMARQAHQAARLEYVSLAEQQIGRRDGEAGREMEAGK